LAIARKERNSLLPVDPSVLAPANLPVFLSRPSRQFEVLDSGSRKDRQGGPRGAISFLGSGPLSEFIENDRTTAPGFSRRPAERLFLLPRHQLHNRFPLAPLARGVGPDKEPLPAKPRQLPAPRPVLRVDRRLARLDLRTGAGIRVGNVTRRFSLVIFASLHLGVFALKIRRSLPAACLRCLP